MTDTMVLLFVFFSCLTSLATISLLALRKSKFHSMTVMFSIVGIITGFIALTFAVPRDPTQLAIDYLGVIVSILAIFATLLLGMQLYNVFKLKEDAEQVNEAKKLIEGYSKKVEYLSDKIENLSKQTIKVKEEISTLSDIASDLMEKSEHALYSDSEDGPDDDK